MRYWLQYHNYDKLGYLPGGYESRSDDLARIDTSHFAVSGITTKKRIVRDSVDDTIFLILGFGGRRKQYILWSWCRVQEVEESDDGSFDAFGVGRVLNPPAELTGTQFEHFKKWNANFSLGFTDISKVPYLARLQEFARERANFELSPSLVNVLDMLPEEVNEPNKMFEGALKKIVVNAYERNPEARQRCIDHYGTNCSVCGISLFSLYGQVADHLIHVHHLRPLSEIDGEYEVDPIADLRPVCPNCHAVLHRRTPAFSIDEVRGFLNKARASAPQ